MYIIIGMLIVCVPVMIIGCLAAWREHHYNNPHPPHNRYSFCIKTGIIKQYYGIQGITVAS
jgi:hypothetical protein